jgi:hypothetical protein
MRLKFILIIIAVLGLSLTTAYAQPAPIDIEEVPVPEVLAPEVPEVVAVASPISPEVQPLTVAQELYKKLRSGEWLAAFGAFLILLVWGLRKFAGRWVKWFNTQGGGYVLGFATSLLLALGLAWKADAGFSFGLLTTALGAAWMASGGWEAFNDFLNWVQGDDKDESDEPAEDETPA